jgi:hypothetical protein
VARIPREVAERSEVYELHSNYVYSAQNHDPPVVKGWTPTQYHPKFHVYDPPSGLETALYENGTERVLAFAGTDPRSWADIKTDIKQFRGIIPDQYLLGLSLAREARSAFGPSLVITGHSLGGGLACYAGLLTTATQPAGSGVPRNETIWQYNAAGLGTGCMRVLEHNHSSQLNDTADHSVVGINIKGEIVSNFFSPGRNRQPILRQFRVWRLSLPYIGTTELLGTVYYVRPTKRFRFGIPHTSISLHYMASLIEAMNKLRRSFRNP